MEKLNYSDDIAAIKKKLLDQSFLDGIADGKEKRKRDSKIADGLRSIPVAKMIDEALFLRENILPRIKGKGGDKAADFIFFSEVYNSLLWAIVLADRYDYLEQRYIHLKCSELLARQNFTLLEHELKKYTTLEEFFLSDGLNHIAQGIKDRAEELLKQTKKT